MATKKITKPTLCRGVIYTAHRGHEAGDVDEYAGVIVKVWPDAVHFDGEGKATPAPDTVDIVTHGSHSTYHNNGVRYDEHGAPNTWRYPSPTQETIEVGA